MQNIFIGNLAPKTSPQQLRDIFAAFGEVLSVSLVKNRDTGDPRGFAFVEMSSEAEAKRAIAAVHGSLIDERVVTVNEARPKEQRNSPSTSQMRRHRDHRY